MALSLAEPDVPVTITSGTRTPLAQAQAIAYKRKVEGDDPVRKLYGQKDLIGEVLDKGATDTAGMASVLQAQVNRGRFLSRHMRADALDVRTRDLTSSQVKKLKAAAERLGAKALIERDHLHVEKVSASPEKIAGALRSAGGAGGIQAQVAYALRRVPDAVQQVPWWGWVAGGSVVFLLALSGSRRSGRRSAIPWDDFQDDYGDGY